MKNQLNKLIAEYKSLKPFDETCKKKLDKKFRLEFNYNSNHLEGNTLTYGETELLLIFDQTKGNHELRELEEMKAHDVALMMIKDEAADKSKPLTEKFIKDLNHTILVRPFWKDAMTSEGQSTRRQIAVGEYKEFPNSVIQSNGEIFEYTSPQETPILMAELVQWYNTEAAKKELTAIELVALLHYRYIRIHPFDDGNGRVARLLVNYILYSNDLPPVIIKTDDKKNYLRALQQADAGDLQAFINYMIQQLAWSLDLSIKAARGEEIEEQDDWEKQLSLLKKGLGASDNKILRKSEETLKDVFNYVIGVLAHSLENKISQFDSLFMSRYIGFAWNSLDIEYFQSLSAALDSLDAAYRNSNNEANYNFLNRIVFCFYFNNYRSPFIVKSIGTLDIVALFDSNAYAIQYGNKIITKLYNEFLTEKEINSIVSDIGKDLVEKIEKVIKS